MIQYHDQAARLLKRVQARVEPGDLLAASRGPIDHKGIASDRIGPDGQLMVISASKVKGIVVEETQTEFAGGRLVRRVGRSQLHQQVVVEQARALIGQRYDLLHSSDCEHNRALGMEAQSPQLRAAVTLGVVALFLFEQ